MKRLTVSERPGWSAGVEAEGLVFHQLANRREYWGEGSCYALHAAEVDALERATREVEALCLEAAQFAVDHHRYAQLGIPELAVPLVERAWASGPPSLYGRLDFAFGPDQVPKLLELHLALTSTASTAGSARAGSARSGSG